MGRDGWWSAYRWRVGTTVALLLFALFVFESVLRDWPSGIPPDQYYHVNYVLTLSEHGLKLPHPLYHYTLAAAIALAPNREWDTVKWCAIGIMVAAVAVRGWFTHVELCTTVSVRAASVICLLLAVAMSLPGWWSFPSVFLYGKDANPVASYIPQIYMGQINPNVLHNPTALFAAPFALLVFLEGMRYLDAPGLKVALAVSVWSGLCVLAKPNYVLAFLPCFALAVGLVAYRKWRRDRRVMTPEIAYFALAVVLPVAAFSWQLLWKMEQNEFLLAPFRAWRFMMSRNIPASILLGTAFPAAVVACFPRGVLYDRRLLFAWAVLSVAVVQFALFSELARESHANFYWGLIPADYILFMESCRFLAGRPARLRVGLCYSVFGLHVVSGLIYLTRSMQDPYHTLLF